MSATGSVRGGERIRLFCGLRLPDDVAGAVAAWQDAELRDGRVVPREHLHVTLAFLGHRPREEVEPVAAELRGAAAAAAPIVFEPVRYRETRSVAMVVLADAGGAAGDLARDLHERLRRLGVYEPEKRPWLAHLTVLRFRRPPRLAPSLPELGPFRPSDAALYHSVLRSSGAQYEALETFALGG
ncbi:MAG TPA: RNA 2',3'-cyclic phosphodiesterase [Gaiellaceae bacterium]